MEEEKKTRLYYKSDGELYTVDSAGNEIRLSTDGQVTVTYVVDAHVLLPKEKR